MFSLLGCIDFEIELVHILEIDAQTDNHMIWKGVSFYACVLACSLRLVLDDHYCRGLSKQVLMTQAVLLFDRA